MPVFRRAAVVAICLLTFVAARAHAQETWLPAYMTDGVTKTIDGVKTSVANGPVPDGTPIPGWDETGLPNRPILNPQGFVENPLTNEWIVADTYHSRLLRFASDHHPPEEPGAFLGEISTSLNGIWSFPYAPVIDDVGTILVPDINAQSIKALVPDGSGGYVISEIASFTDALTDPLNPVTQTFSAPYRLAFVPDRVNGMNVAAGIGSLVVLDAGANKVYKLSLGGGIANPSWSLLLGFGHNAADCGCAAPGYFNFPTGMATDAAGNIYVTDPQNTSAVTIQVFDPNGTPLQIISEGLSSPWALTIAPDGRLFVADTGYNRIAVFSKYDGNNPSQSLVPMPVRIGSASQPLGGVFLPGGPNPAGPAGELQEPTAVAFDSLGRLLVADPDNDRVQLFDKAQLTITAIAVPQTLPAAQSSVDVRVTVTLPSGENPMTDVAPSVPTVTFPGSAVVDTTPSCILTPASTSGTDCQSLSGFPLPVGGELEFTFRFDRTLATGPVQFRTAATGVNISGLPVSSAAAETYAVAVDGTPASNPPLITASYDVANPLPPSNWFGTAPVLVDLSASVPGTADGTVQKIEYGFGATPPMEGDQYVCYDLATTAHPADPSCVVPVYKGGVTTMWYRALSSHGLYDTLVPYALDPTTTVSVPGWTRQDVKLDFNGPTVFFGLVSSSHNGWLNQLPAVVSFTATDTESLLDTVEVSPSGPNPSWSFTSTPNVSFNSGTVTFDGEGLGTIDVTATDQAGNISFESTTLGIDVTPPTIDPAVVSGSPLVSSGGATWSSGPITATFTAHDALSGFGGGPTTTCTRTVSSGVDVTVTCDVSDQAGNAAATASAGPFSIDSIAPSSTFTPPAGGVQVGTIRWYPSAPGNVDFLFTDTGIGFTGGATTPVSAPVIGTSATATAADLVGNSTTATAGPFVVDSAAPTVTATPDIPTLHVGSTGWYDHTVSVLFSANDNGGSGFSLASSVQTATSTAVSTGTPVSASFNDVVGNSGSAAAGPFNIDLSAPTVTATTYEHLDGSPLTPVSAGGALVVGGPFQVRFTATDAGVGFSAATPQLTDTHVVVVNSPSSASTTFTDLLGHSVSATAGPFVFETTAPTYTFTTTPAGVLVGATAWYQTAPASVTFVGDDGPTGIGFPGQTQTVTVPVISGVASYDFTDQVGNTTHATAGPFNIDAAAPTIAVTPDPAGAMVGTTPWYGQPVSVLFTANDNGGSGFIDPVTQLPTQTATNTQLSSGAGVNATFTDLVHNSAAASAGPFNIDTAAPTVSTSVTFLDNSPATGATIGGTTWFKASVNVTLTATDAGVGFSATAPQATSSATTLISGASQTVSHTFQDLLDHSVDATAGPYGIDAVAPTLTVTNIIVAANPVSALVTYGTNVSASDNVDPSPAVSCSPASGSSFPFGVTTVSCTATDAVGNTSAAQTFTVTVQDRTAPTLTVPANITLAALVPTIVNFAASATDNLDLAPAVLCTPASGTLFPLGLTTVSCTATDASHNSTTKTFMVTLSGTPPVIVVPVVPAVEATGPSGASVSYTVTATDGVGPVPVTCNPASGSVFLITTTTVTCKATNAAGTTTKTFPVTVRDTTKPVLTAANVSTVATSASGANVSYTVTVQDLVDGTSDPIICSKASGSTFPIGTTTVTCSATDHAGNKGTTSFTVTVTHSVPVCSAASANPGSLWPPNHKWATIGINGVTNADGGTITYKINSIFQDEPTSGLGDGDTAIDGDGVGTSTAKVRAERSGSGNGRVYHIKFTATAAAGGSCSGEVKVGVPHDQGGSAAVDGGSLYDSTTAAPDAAADTASTRSGVAVVVNVLSNDSDPLGYSLVIASVTAPAHGTATIASGKITYTPTRGYLGTDAFSYTVSDQHGGTDTATVTVTITQHSDNDGCDHDQHKNGHHDGDDCDHDRWERDRDRQNHGRP